MTDLILTSYETDFVWTPPTTTPVVLTTGNTILIYTLHNHRPSYTLSKIVPIIRYNITRDICYHVKQTKESSMYYCRDILKIKILLIRTL